MYHVLNTIRKYKFLLWSLGYLLISASLPARNESEDSLEFFLEAIPVKSGQEELYMVTNARLETAHAYQNQGEYFRLMDSNALATSLHEYETMRVENGLLLRENRMKQELLVKNRVMGISAVAALVLLIIIFILQIRVKNAYRLQSELIGEQNQIILSQNEEIIQQNEELEKYKNQLEHAIRERTRELKDALKLTQESNRLKSVFIQNISHEIRTPMNAIVGFSQVLKNQTNREEIEKNLQYIVMSCYDLLNTVTKVLSVARLETEDSQLDLETVSSYELNRRLSDGLNKTAKLCNTNPHTVFAIDLADFEGNIKTDISKVKRILGYLLENAFKFTVKGKVVVSSRESGDNLLFKVSDTGVGIEKEKMNGIFDLFVKGDDPQNPSRGTGLGLTIVDVLVKAMNGSVQVESGNNSGTVFSVRIPRKTSLDSAIRRTA